MKTLVTGAGGFIGSHLTERLVRDGSAVRALVHYNSRNDWGLLELLPADIRSEIEVVSGDIRDPGLMDRTVTGCDLVFHLSSLIAIPYSYVAPQSYIETNVSGAVNVLEASLRHDVRRLVHTSTSECYGTAEYVPIDEGHPLKGQSPYSASKIGADMVAYSFWTSFDLPVTILRPFNTYGPRQSARAVIPTIISQALDGGVIRLGSLEPTRDLTFVDDTVEGFLRVARCDAALGEVVNLGTGQEISIGDLARLVLRVTGVEGRVETDPDRLRPEKSEVLRLLSNNEKARGLLGWSPSVSLEDGVARTVAWFRENRHRYKSDIYNR